MNRTPLILLPLLATAAVAQFAPLPAPSLTLRAAPRATWTSVTSAGINTTGTTFRCDNTGATTDTTIYVFGGCLNNNTATTVNDLYAFDAVNGTFTQVHDGVITPAPHARGRAALAWNPVSQRVVLFGGDNRATGPLPADTLLADTWEYDPVTNTWTETTPASSPSPRRWASMCFEPTTSGMLLFGGDVGAGVCSSETWLYLGGTWTQMGPLTVPPPRRMASLMHRNSPEFDDVVMVGGQDPVSFLPDLYNHLDVWRWDGADWSLLSNYDWGSQTGSFPASAIANQAVYDASRKRIVMQSGQGVAANTAVNATFIYGTTVYNGSPTNYTSEFDCLTNTWSLYASSLTGTTPYNNNDPQIGRISRYFAGYVSATGKVYKLCGQNAAGSGSKPTYNAYAYQANPVAAAVSYGAGCTGPGGVLTLTADNDPWTDRTWSATCSGLGAGSLAMTIFGTTQQALPLVLVLPIAGLGCDLLTSADLLVGPALPVGGQVAVGLPIANDPALAGVVINTQVAELEFNGLFQWSGLYTSNGVQITVGAL